MKQVFSAIQTEPALVVGSAVHDAADLRPGQRPGAHDAGFEGDEKGAIGQVFAAEVVGGRRESEDFGVGGHVGELFRLVVCAGNDAVVAYDYGPDGHFAGLVGHFGLRERLLHEISIGKNGKHKSGGKGIEPVSGF